MKSKTEGHVSRKFLPAFAAVLLLAGAGLAASAAGTGGLRALLLKGLAFIEDSGPLAPLVFLALFTAACVLLLPTFYLTIGAGLLFGLRNGFLVATFSVAAGASAAFFVARRSARARLEELCGSSIIFIVLREAAQKEGWKIVFLSRLSPILPFNIFNYAFGLSGIPFLPYFLASWAGSIPWTLLYVYAGSLAADIAGLHPAVLPVSGSGRALSFLGLAATAAAAFTAGSAAMKALRRHLPGPPGTGALSGDEQGNPGNETEDDNE